MTWFFTLFKKELVEIKNDLRRPVFLFGAALAYLIVFGMLAWPVLNVFSRLTDQIKDWWLNRRKHGAEAKS